MKHDNPHLPSTTVIFRSLPSATVNVHVICNPFNLAHSRIGKFKLEILAKIE